MTTIKSILEELWLKAYINPDAEWKRPQERESDINQALQQIEQLIEEAKPKRYEGYANQIEAYKSAIEQFDSNLKKVIR